MAERRYPFDALPACLGLSIHRTGKALQLSGSTMHNYRIRGIPEHAADELAVRAGLHPALVWDDWVDDGLTVVDRMFLESGWRQAWLYREQAA